MTRTHQQWRTSQYYAYDPYSKDIAPALLNSVDIKKYIDIGCLVDEATFDSNLLKPASYEMRFLGKLYDWVITDEGQLKPCCREIVEEKPTILRRNSITYLWMSEKLFLPEYIAARFNLHIRHVHKGLLLGTGPLVDSGFSGSLLVPLHNLTNNDYEITGGDGIIWVEFTKLSENDYWVHQDKQGIERSEDLKAFPNAKDLDDPFAYFRKSGVTAQGGVQSAFHGALDETRNAAKAARESAQESHANTERFRRLYTWIGVGTAILVVAAIATIIVQGYSLVSQVVTTTNEVHRHEGTDQQQTTGHLQTVVKRIEDLEERLKNATTDFGTLKNRVDLIQQNRTTVPDNNQK